jgi:hypothetical protein
LKRKSSVKSRSSSPIERRMAEVIVVVEAVIKGEDDNLEL